VPPNHRDRLRDVHKESVTKCIVQEKTKEIRKKNTYRFDLLKAGVQIEISACCLVFGMSRISVQGASKKKRYQQLQGGE
jgi:hypothetical protein